jgi:hypothetical protein
MATNDTRDQQPVRRFQEHLEDLGRLILSTTFVVVLLFDAIDFVAHKIPHRSLSNTPNSVELTPGPEKPVAAVKEPSIAPVKSGEVVQTSGPLANSTAEKPGNSPRSSISKNLTSRPLSPSFIRTRSSSHSGVAVNAPVQTPRAVAETRSRQLLPQVSYPLSAPVEFRFYDGRWHKRELAKLPEPTNHASPGAVGMPMNQSR